MKDPAVSLILAASSAAEFNDLHITDICAIYSEPEHGHYLMYPGSACRTGINAEHPEGLVIDHLCDVRVPADKDIRSKLPDQLQRPGCIPAGIASDVNHKHILRACTEEEIFLRFPPDVKPVNVAPDGTQRPERHKFGDNTGITGVTCMPDLIDTGKVLVNSRINPAVRV